MADRLDPTFVRQQIGNLRVSYPEIAADEDEWLLTLESESDLVEILTAAIRRMLEDKATIGGISAYIAELKARQDRLDQRVEAMRTLAFRLMQAAEVRKLELVPATLSIRAGVRKVIITDEAALPDQYVRIKREPNKIVIKEHIEQGIDVSGAELSNAEPSLALRIK